jgi:cytoskeletal protein CcmA (bactofilin family)
MRLRKSENGLGDPGKVNSVIGPGAVFSGECNVEGAVRIDGEMIGTVRATRMAVIGKSGTVRGDVIIDDAIVGGRVYGSIIATGRVELQSGALVEGDITTSKLVVEEGTVFNGKCSMVEQHAGTIKLFAPGSAVEKMREEG